MRYLVTGGCGFVGSNIVARLLEEGAPVRVLDNLSRAGALENLKWLTAQGLRDFVRADVRDAVDVSEHVASFAPDVVLHLAGQVSMLASLEDPRTDFEVNAIGTLNVLEAVREHAREAAVVYASTNKVYGDLGAVPLVEGTSRYTAPSVPTGIDESAPIDLRTPYGCSKGTADQYVLDYARIYGLRTIVLRHSTIYGGRQFATVDQGWVGWFCRKSLEALQDAPGRPPFSVAGDGKQVRDLLWVDDAVRCYLAAAACPTRARGEAFNIGGGMANSCSVLELLQEVQKVIGGRLRYLRKDWRPHDQKFFVADGDKARRLLRWEPRVGKAEGIRRMLEWTEQSMAAER